MSRVLGRGASHTDIEEFLARLRGSSPDTLNELEARIARVRENLNRAQVARNGGREIVESDSFSSEERMLLREVATREIRPEASLRSPDPRPGEIDFIGSEQDTAIQLQEEPGENAPAEAKERARRGFKEWFDDAQSCRESRPDDANRSLELRNTLEQMAITTGVTTVGTIAHVGISKIQWNHFGLDLMTSLISTGVSMSWMHNSDTLLVRWLKIFTWGHLRSDMDAEIYRISPWTDTRGVPMEEAVTERRDFNYSWNAKSSWVNPLMFGLLNGTECMLEREKGAAAAARFARGAFVFKTGVSVATSILYQRQRGNSVRAERTP